MTPPQTQKKIDPPSLDRLPALVESLLFVAEEPQELGALAKSLGVTRQRVERVVEELIATPDGRGVLLQRLGDRVQLVTTPDAAPYIERLMEVEHGRLSRAALETLAIIAYRGPITRTGIESVRGVNADQSVATLLARELIEEVGRAPGPGRPVLFGATVRFLEYFGLQRPDDLPPLPPLEQDDGLEPDGEASPPAAPDAAAPSLENETPSGDDAGAMPEMYASQRDEADEGEDADPPAALDIDSSATDDD